MDVWESNSRARFVSHLVLPLVGVLLACVLIAWRGQGGRSYAALIEPNDPAELQLEAGFSGLLLTTAADYRELVERSNRPGAISDATAREALGLAPAKPLEPAVVILSNAYKTKRAPQLVIDYAIFTDKTEAHTYVASMKKSGGKTFLPVPVKRAKEQPLERVKRLCMAWEPPPWAILGTAQSIAKETRS